MARTREFDPDKALQVAIDVFWEKGYFDASVDEVVRRSGVAKYGIYGTFGSKDQLFKRALEQYAEDRGKGFISALDRPDAALPELKHFFLNAAEMMTRDGQRIGCLLCNTGVELGDSNPEIQKIVQEFFTSLARAIRKCLKRAVAKGQLGAEKDSAQIATYLATELRTMLMLSKSGESRRAIKSHIKIALRVLDQ